METDPYVSGKGCSLQGVQNLRWAVTLIGHAKDHHHGIILKNTQLNRPPWLDWIRYNDDELEEEFCFGENFG